MYFQDGLLGEFGAPVGGPMGYMDTPPDFSSYADEDAPVTLPFYNDQYGFGATDPLYSGDEGVPMPYGMAMDNIRQQQMMNQLMSNKSPSGMISFDQFSQSQASDPNYGQFMRKQQAMNTEAPMMEDAPAPEAPGEMSGSEKAVLMQALSMFGGGGQEQDMFANAPGIVRGRPMQQMNFGPSYSQGYTGGLLG